MLLKPPIHRSEALVIDKRGKQIAYVHLKERWRNDFNGAQKENEEKDKDAFEHWVNLTYAVRRSAMI